MFERLSAIPGVLAVGGATTVPTTPLGPDFERPVWPEGTSPDRSTHLPASVRMVTPGYFRALGAGWVAKAGLRLLAFGIVAGLIVAWTLSGTLEGQPLMWECEPCLILDEGM